MTRSSALLLAFTLTGTVLAEARPPDGPTRVPPSPAFDPGSVRSEVELQLPGALPGPRPRAVRPPAGEPPEGSSAIERVGAWPYGPSYAVAHDPARDLAFLSSGGVVLILDVSDPTAPSLLNEDIHSVGLVEDIFYQGSTQRLFLAAGEGGLEIWDVADPAAPARLSVTEVLYIGYDTPVGHVEVRDHLAVVESAWGYVHSLDVSDPTNPIQIAFNGQMGNPARDIHIEANGLIHTSGAQNYVRLFMDDGGALFNAGTKGFTLGPNKVFGHDEVAYVGYGTNLYILDLLIFGFPPWSVTDVGGIAELERHGDLLYLINGTGLRIYDVAVHNNPIHVGTRASEMSYYDFVVSDGHAWIAAGLDGLRVIDVGDPAVPREVGAYEDVYSVTWSSVVVGDLAYLAHDRDGLLILDLQNQARPELVGRLEWPEVVRDVAIQGGLAYVANSLGGLRVVDVSDPAQPVEIGSLGGLRADRVAPAGDVVYVLHAVINQPWELRVVDVSDPTLPVEIGSAPLPDLAWELAVEGDTLYVAGHDGGVRIFDVANPAAPVEIASIPLPSVTEVEVRGALLWIAAHDTPGGGLFAYDVSNPSDPQLVGSYTDAGFAPFHLHLDGDYAYVSRSFYLWLFLIGDPSAPVYLEEYALPGDFFGVTSRGDGRVFVSDGPAGFQIVDNTLFSDPGGGLQWQTLDSGTTENLNGVSFVDTESGWAVGDSGTILATGDAGDSWTVQRSGGADLTAVDFVDALNGWAVGGGGLILRTADGGALWSPQPSGTGEGLFDVDFVDADHGWAVGGGGTILATADGGTSWSPQASGTSLGLFSVSFADAATGWAATSEFGLLLRTTDGGASWQSVATGSIELLLAVEFPDPLHGWAVGSFGEVVSTSDGGATWTEQATPHPPHWLWDVDFVDASNGWAVGFDGQVLHTSSGGLPWEDQPTGVHEQLNGVSFVDTGHGWAVGDAGTIVRARPPGESDEIFVDGFESGDTSAWSSAVP